MSIVRTSLLFLDRRDDGRPGPSATRLCVGSDLKDDSCADLDLMWGSGPNAGCHDTYVNLGTQFDVDGHEVLFQLLLDLAGQI